MPDLTTRLLAEIERREELSTTKLSTGEYANAQTRAYLQALRKVVERAAEYVSDPKTSPPDALQISADMLAAVAEALGVETNE